MTREPKPDKPATLHCRDCDRSHADWRRVGRPYAPSPDARGRLQPIKCEHCGATDKVTVS